MATNYYQRQRDKTFANVYGEPDTMVNRDLLEAHRKTMATPKGVFSADNETLSNLHSVSKKSIKDIKAVSIDRRAESMHLSKRTKTAKLKTKTFDTVKRPQTKV